MANRFYIPQRGLPTATQLSSLGLQLYGLKQQGDIANRRLDLTAKEQEMRGEMLPYRKQALVSEYGEPGGAGGLAQKRVGIAERKLNIEERKDADLANFNTLKSGMTVKFLKDLGIPENHALLQEISGWGQNPEITQGKAYDMLKDLYKNYRQDLSQVILKNYLSQLEKDPLYARTPKGIKQARALQALDESETGAEILDPIFSQTIEARKRRAGTPTEKLPSTDQVLAQEVLSGKMTIEEAMAAKQKPKTEPETFGEPYQLEGATVQKGTRGTIRQVVPRPPRETEESFKSKKLKEMWPRLSEEAKLTVLRAVPKDGQLDEKTLIRIYSNLLTDPRVRKELKPVVDAALERLRAEGEMGTGNVLNVIPEGSQLIGTSNGQEIWEAPDGKRYRKIPSGLLKGH